MTEKAQSADFRRKPQIFADSPLLLKVQGLGERRKPQKTADFRRKPQIGLRHLRCVTFSSALEKLVYVLEIRQGNIWGVAKSCCRSFKGSRCEKIREKLKGNNQGGPVRFGYGLGVERFKRFRFSVPAVPLQKGFFLCFSTV